MRTKFTTCLILALSAIALPIEAHHSFAAEYDASKPYSRHRLDQQSGMDQSAFLPVHRCEGRPRKFRNLDLRRWRSKRLVAPGLSEEYMVDVKEHPLLPGEHATQQWCRLARMVPAALSSPALPAAPAGAGGRRAEEEVGGEPGGCCLEVSQSNRLDLESWLRGRELASVPLIAVQVGNKRTMRRGLKRLAPNNKYWPNERWAAVLRHIRHSRPEHAIVMLGTAPEYGLNQEIAKCAGVDRLYNMADDLPIPRLVALLAHARALITVDSGPAHVAAAVGCPQVVLFGKALPSLYRPWGTAGADARVVTGQAGGEPSMLGIECARSLRRGMNWRCGPARSVRAACPGSPARRRVW